MHLNGGSKGLIRGWKLFLIFVRFRVFYRADIASARIAYMDNVREPTLHRPQNVRLAYDRCFRERMAHEDANERA